MLASSVYGKKLGTTALKRTLVRSLNKASNTYRISNRCLRLPTMYPPSEIRDTLKKKENRCSSSLSSWEDEQWQSNDSHFQRSPFLYIAALGLGLAVVWGATTSEARAGDEVPDRRPLTAEVAFLRGTKLNFNGSPPTILNWSRDGTCYVELVQLPSGMKQLRKVDAASGESEPLYNTEQIQARLASALGGGHPGAQLARRVVANGKFTMSPDEGACLVQHDNNIFYYHFQEARIVIVSLDTTPGKIKVPSFSPDGSWVSFVRDWDLKVVSVAATQDSSSSATTPSVEFSLTEGGNPDLMNGVLDWVYQEEVYGRGDYKGYWWAPDSKNIVFMQLDESPIASYSLVDHLHQHLVTEDSRYPKAGDANPRARLGVIGLPSLDKFSELSQPRWVELDEIAQPDDLLIVDVGFSANGDDILFQAQNKEQTWLRLCSASLKASKMSPRTVLHETTPAWVNVLGKPAHLKNGSFLWLSEANGYSHIYMFSPGRDPNGEKWSKAQLTDGKWAVSQLHGVDTKEEFAYFSGTKDGWLNSHVYRVVCGLRGQGIERLTQGSGTHRARFNPECTTFLSTWSDASNPPQMKILDSSGKLVRSVYEGPKDDAAAPYRRGFSKPLFFQLPCSLKEAQEEAATLQIPVIQGNDSVPLKGAHAGKDLMNDPIPSDVLDAMMILPPEFNPDKEYPLLVYQYSGPHFPQVKDVWQQSTRWVWHQYLAQLGYVVCYVDCRTSSGKGAASVWPVHRNFGPSEMNDIKSAAQWLKRLPFVDSDRVGLWGWSYGGYMTLYTLAHCNEFKIGISGAPVTDWKLYDTIYTERYMGTPKSNPNGYISSSVLEAVAAGKVPRAKLLLIHGAMDDNVHMQNSLQLLHQFHISNYTNMEFMVYPRDRHGCSTAPAASHLYKKMTEFITDNL